MYWQTRWRSRGWVVARRIQSFGSIVTSLLYGITFPEPDLLNLLELLPWDGSGIFICVARENPTEFIAVCTTLSLHTWGFPIGQARESPCMESQWGEALLQIQLSGLCHTMQTETETKCKVAWVFPPCYTNKSTHQSSMSFPMLHQQQIKTKQDEWRMKDDEQDGSETKWWTRNGCEMQWWTDRHEVEQTDGQQLKAHWPNPTEPYQQQTGPRDQVSFNKK